MKSKRLSGICVVLLVLCVSSLGVGCFRLKAVRSIVPAKVHFGEARRLVVIGAEGHPLFRKQLLDELGDQAKAKKWWALDERSGARVDLRIISGQAILAPASAPARSEVYLKLDLHRWMVERSIREREVVEGESRRQLREVSYLSKAAFRVTAIDTNKRVVLRQKLYEGLAVLKGSHASRKQAKAISLRRAVELFLNEITPSYFREVMQLDTSQDDLGEIIVQMKKGFFALAAKQLNKLHKEQPKRADILYNLAVASEGLSRYREALTLYDEAIKRKPKPYYLTARARCAQRLEEHIIGAAATE